ncbi:DUF5344 family protein [Pseudogracilibacillus sp. SO30301A]|uniref:DUF5344 family protein n=1 Tax=Pseudogracilibacillus sp. SO30301A TaxID=3098291 RepID=UPI00300DCA72
MEIKITEAPIRQSVNALSTSTQALSSSISTIEGESQLECIAKINEINQTYILILEQYKALLLQNSNVTEDTVEALIEKDRGIADAILLNSQK